MTNVIVIGAGTAGCVAAKVAAKAGLKVTLIDHKPQKDIGKKVCGDGTPESLFSTYNKWVRPPIDETTNLAGYTLAHAGHSHRRPLVIPDKIHMIDRHLFGQRLLEEALAEGVELVEEKVVGWRHSGVRTKHGVLGGFVVDASGWNSQYRKGYLAQYTNIWNDINIDEVAVCYRAIIKTNRFTNEDHNELYFLDSLPGGYLWVFPEGDGVFNVGAGYLKGPKVPVKQIVKRYIGDSKVLHEGGGLVPISTPMKSFVNYHALFIGDAGYQTNSATGGGIPFSLVGGGLAGEILGETEKWTLTNLWTYNQRYHDIVGRLLWNIYPFSTLLRKLREEELRFMVDEEIICGNDIISLRDQGELTISSLEKFIKVTKALKRPKTFSKLASYASISKNLKELTAKYPTPDGFAYWRYEIDEILGAKSES